MSSIMSGMRWVRQYAEETPFHGLSMAYRAFSLWEVVSWILMVMLCIVMTIQQTIALVEVYVGEPTSTSTTIRKNNSIAFNLVFCVNPSTGPPLLIETDQEIIQQLLNNLTSEDLEMLRTEAGIPLLNPKLVTLMAEIFRSLTMAEIYFFFSGGLSSVPWSYSGEDEAMAVDRVFNYLISANVSFTKLFKVVAVHLCNLMHLSVSIHHMQEMKSMYQVQTYNVCRMDAIASFSMLGFCVKLLPNTVFNTPVDYLQIYVVPQNVFPVISSLENSGEVHLDLSGRQMYASYFNKGNVLGIPFNSKSKVLTHLQGHYVSQNLRRAPCSSSLSRFNCDMRCYAYTGYTECQCWPFITSFVKPLDISCCFENMTIPNNKTRSMMIPHYDQCLKNLTFPLEHCKSKCLPDCEYQQFGYLFDANLEDPYQDNGTLLLMTVSDFVYPLMVEALTKDWQSIMNEFGGNIGLWLGGSILAIIHLPVFLAKCLLGMVSRGKISISMETQT